MQKSKSKKKTTLPEPHRSILHGYCQGHGIVPSLISRQNWAQEHGLAPKDIHHAIRTMIADVKKGKKAALSYNPWDLPRDVVKTEPGSSENEEQHSPVECAELRQSVAPPPTIAVSPVSEKPCEEPVVIVPSDDISRSSTPQVSNLPTTGLSFIMNNNNADTLDTDQDNLQLLIANTYPSSSTSDPFLPSAETLSLHRGIPTIEIVDLLSQNNFFTLTLGPNAITLEDMTDWPVFEGKLTKQKCSLDPFFVWRTLKTFYFFM